MKVLALVESPDHVCCRYRIRAFEPALAAAGCSLAIEGLARGIPGRLLQFVRLRQYDTVILQRRLIPLWQFSILRRYSRRLIFDFDDAVFHRDSYHPRGIVCPHLAKRFAATVRASHVIIAGNAYLAQSARKAGARPETVKIIPDCIEPEAYTLAKHSPGAHGLDLLWIGSSSTLQGLEEQHPLWKQIADEIPGIRFRVICDRFPDFSPLSVTAIPWSEETEALELAAGDVGINWMPDDLWSLGKCGLKILQYQAAGLPVIANPVGVHKTMIEPRITGFLAQTPGQWIEAVKRLVGDASLRRRMGRQARQKIEADYSVTSWATEFVRTVLGE